MIDKTHIANPLYDVVFRYMMEDNKVAKLFLSAILDKEIEELIFTPTEYSRKLYEESATSITLTRMDFSAKIKQEDGTEKLILIELQKAKYYFQTLRFRRYLGKQYQNPENVNSQGEVLPIYPIYILGEAFSIEKRPVIRVQRDYIDVATQDRIVERHPFIEALTHDAIVIQVPHLKGSRRTILEQFLSIFDQSQQADVKGHILALQEAHYPERYHAVIRRLIKALAHPKLEEDMEMEDEVINEFHKKDAKIAQAETRAKQAEEEARQAQRDKESAQKERETAQRERETAQREKEKAQNEAIQAKTEKQNMIKALHQSGMSIENIAKVANATGEEIRNIIES